MLQTIAKQVLRFVMPWSCAGCRTPLPGLDDDGFCEACWLWLPRIQGWICDRCGLPLKDGGKFCFDCRRHPSRVLIRAAADYSGGIRQALQRFKYGGRKSLGLRFAQLLESAWDLYSELHPIDALVPVPLYPHSLHERGYNQAAVLAQYLGKRLSIPVHSRVLVRQKETVPQFRLKKPDRLLNLRDAFALSRAYDPDESTEGLRILLIDDICTTGATLKECAKVLKAAGAKAVKALVLARDL